MPRTSDLHASNIGSLCFGRRISMPWISGLCLECRISMPDMPNIQTILTNIGHRFVHQSGLDESSGGFTTTFRHGIAFRVYFMFSKIGKNHKYYKMLTKHMICDKNGL